MHQPFRHEHASWAWARNPRAELMSQDGDLLLWSARGLPLLVAAAADPACPAQELRAHRAGGLRPRGGAARGRRGLPS
ncbi:hypothetical protein GTQ99_00760 [Kineococcus sp. T13]|uniref:hypothetical protein n=1 Tax=Kineococcus vitellinus TaxID=2696565 RepID=UPI0014127770|nr:hypothetical protein [Kineococcus vitellinus]NAZ73963.1 hypothetical protein [Kineococcus vitellinus]